MKKFKTSVKLVRNDQQGKIVIFVRSFKSKKTIESITMDHLIKVKIVLFVILMAIRLASYISWQEARRSKYKGQ